MTLLRECARAARGLLLAAAIGLASAAQAISIGDVYTRTSGGETFDAAFTDPIGGQTLGSYSGLVEVLVSGIGSIGPGTADAFYVYNYDQGGYYYELSLGTTGTPLQAFHPDQTILRAISFIDGVGAVGSFTRPGENLGDHSYHFVVDLAKIGVSSPTQLQFGITEGQYGDNNGAYSVTVYQLAEGASAVPAPATWAMMVMGFGMVGVALRKRRPVIA